MKKKDIFSAAWQQLEKAVVHYQGRPIGTVASFDPGPNPLNYDQVFTRDFFISALAFLLNDEFAIVRNFLSLTADLQATNKSTDCFEARRGLMPASFKTIQTDGHEKLVADFGEHAIGRVTPVDSSLWWLILLRLYYLCSGDRDFVTRDKTAKTIKAILDLYLLEHFELVPTLLVPDGAFMIDRRMGMYGHPLDIEVLFFAALRASSELMAMQQGKESVEYKSKIDRRVGHLADHIRTYYWIDRACLKKMSANNTEEFGTDATNKYNLYPASIPKWAWQWIGENDGYFAGNIGPGRMDFRFLSLGNLLSVMTSLADSDQQDKILNFIENQWEAVTGHMPMKACCPALEDHEWQILTGADPKNSAWSYHNGGSWPFLMCFLAAAGAARGREFLTRDTLNLKAQRLLEDNWPEYYDGRDGSQVGKEARKLQIWTISGYIAASALLENPEKAALLSFDSEPEIVECPLKR